MRRFVAAAEPWDAPTKSEALENGSRLRDSR